MSIFEKINTMSEEMETRAGDSSLAFLKNNYFEYNKEAETLRYAIKFEDIEKYRLSYYCEKRHYDLFCCGDFYETGITEYHENNKNTIKPYILAFYTKEYEYDENEVRKIDFVDRINKIKITQNDIQLVFNVSLIEDKLYIEDEGILYNNEIVPLHKINIMCQFYDMRHEIVTSEQVFFDENKITFSTIRLKRIATKNGIITKHINNRVVMNLKTGRTYRLNEFDLATKKVVNKKRHPFVSLSAWTLNWTNLNINKLAKSEFNKIGKAIEESVNDKDIIPFNEYIKDTENIQELQVLIAYNTNPFVPYSVLMNMYQTKADAKCEINSYDKMYTKNFNCKVTRNKNVEKELLTFLTAQGYSKKFLGYKLSRTTLYSIKEDKEAFDQILEFSSIEDKNNRWKVVESYFKNNCSLYQLKDFYNSKIYTELKKTHKEKDIVNAVMKIKDMYYLSDLSLAYNRIMRSMPEYKIPTKRLRLNEIHDIVCGDAKKLDDNVYEYHYTKEMEERFNKTIDGYDFGLATDSLQLVEVGTEMGICVGSYGKKVANKHCTIITVKKDNKYVTCIEVCPDGKVNQVKGIRNEVPEEGVLRAFDTYVLMTKINTRTCFDLTMEHRIASEYTEINKEFITVLNRIPMIENGKISFRTAKYEKIEDDCWF